MSAGRQVPTSAIQDFHPRKEKQMYTLQQEEVRAQMSARLGEARQLREATVQARALRLGRRAERAAQRARLALARAL